MAHPGGRPTKYTPELIKKAHSYIDDWVPTPDEVIPEIMPSHVGLADHLDIRRETLYAWAKDPEKEEFSNILDKVLRKQELILLANGLNRTFDSGISKLVLGKHGYHDKTDNTIANPDGSNLELNLKVDWVSPDKGEK